MVNPAGKEFCVKAGGSPSTVGRVVKRFDRMGVPTVYVTRCDAYVIVVIRTSEDDICRSITKESPESGGCKTAPE